MYSLQQTWRRIEPADKRHQETKNGQQIIKLSSYGMFVIFVFIKK